MKHHYLHLGLFVTFIVISTILMINYGIGLTPDRYVLVILVGAIFIKHYKHFIHDFAPFIFILLAYDFLRGFADDINTKIHYIWPIDVTKFLFFGHIPTVDLQLMFYSGQPRVHDYFLSYLYLLHFAVVLILAFFLWLKNRDRFREFILAISIASYVALISYLVVPTAPPWLASKMGYIPPVTKILDLVLMKHPQAINLPTFYHAIGSNLVAAVPSMHAGYSFLVFLFTRRYLPRWSFLAGAYFIAVWVAIVYLGEHYVIDVILGGVLAFLTYKISIWIMKQFGKDFQFL